PPRFSLVATAAAQLAGGLSGYSGPALEPGLGAHGAGALPAFPDPARLDDAVHRSHDPPSGRGWGVGGGPRPAGHPGRQPQQPRRHPAAAARALAANTREDRGGRRGRLLVPAAPAGAGGGALAELLSLRPP